MKWICLGGSYPMSCRDDPHGCYSTGNDSSSQVVLAICWVFNQCLPMFSNLTLYNVCILAYGWPFRMCVYILLVRNSTCVKKRNPEWLEAPYRCQVQGGRVSRDQFGQVVWGETPPAFPKHSHQRFGQDDFFEKTYVFLKGILVWSNHLGQVGKQQFMLQRIQVFESIKRNIYCSSACKVTRNHQQSACYHHWIVSQQFLFSIEWSGEWIWRWFGHENQGAIHRLIFWKRCGWTHVMFKSKWHYLIWKVRVPRIWRTGQ